MTQLFDSAVRDVLLSYGGSLISRHKLSRNASKARHISPEN
ncbi:hypothetical protein FHS32_000394 [Streptomyces albaduncus]|uniref:Uncharacterized protein n=1 Tax=Streptomyces griseoloalbus TaxID=67303 RepID=A0A7W8BHY2_9ACTN|nr:hypothetical protein [Streptomyces albaduncus]